MAQREKLFFGATICFLAMLSAQAYGADCTSGTRISPCFDADALWLPAAPTHFSSVPSSTALTSRTFSVGLGLGYLSKPVTLEALAPDPSGRTVLVVDDVIDASLTAAYAPMRHLELGLVVPMALYRTGTGL